MLATWFKLGVIRILLAGSPALLMAVIQPQHPELAFTFGVIGLSLLSNLKSTRDGEMGSGLRRVGILPRRFYRCC